MADKFLYAGNKEFELTRKLVSEDEIRAFMELSSKQKSVQNLSAYGKNGLTVIWFGVGLLFATLGAALVSYLTSQIQNGTSKDNFPLLFFYICPLGLLLIGCYMLYLAARTFVQPLEDFEEEQSEQVYKSLIQRGRCHSGKIREIETLSPTARRIHYTSFVKTKYHRGMEDATFITNSPVPLDLSDTVVVLTFEVYRVLI
jgi:hypothetical protein